ncbi:MAG: hypothetical protein K6U09_03230 [Acidobacteriia bacterium]|jgi:hypothetical protein|nr:hypothetical protein [Terriglobia bacterium]
MRDRFRVLVAAFVVLCLAGAAAAQSLPTPEQYLGFRVGTDRKLATWDQVVRYMQLAAQASDRIRYEELGKSTLGHPFILLTISSPQNLARLEEIRADQRRLAYPYELDESAAEAIFRRNPAVVLITLTIHSTEVAATQMSLELVYRLATEQSEYVEDILNKVVFLLAPSVNPDGQVLVVDWYNRNVGTEYEYSPLPWLYHKYTGHDNNRDAYMLTQVETRLVTKILYEDWFPLVFLDEHQMGSSGARLFVPPFADPINPNIEPAVMAAANLLGMYMFHKTYAAGLTGVQYGERFTWWWQGSAKNGAWYHNMVGLLTEMASAWLASPVEQRRTRLYQLSREEEPSGGPRDPREPLPPPRDTWARTNYPRPWLGGTWRLRDIVDYELVLTWALLEGVAANREMLQRNFYTLNRKAIETGRKGNPFAWVFPPEQHDPGAAAKLLEVLGLAGIEIYRAAAEFTADGQKFPAGSYVIPMAQPFRNYAKDLLEPQSYPMRPVRAGETPERPYDVTGWTLPYQMGVTAIRIDRPFDASLERFVPAPPAGALVGNPRARNVAFLLPHEWNASAHAVNRLLARNDVEVYWAAQSFQIAGQQYPEGTIVVRPTKSARDPAAILEHIARETHVRITAVEWPQTTLNAWRLRAPRIALYQPWTANMDEGWTRWLLEQYGFPYTTVHNADLRAGNLRARFDVIVFADQSKNSILNGNRGEWIRPEYRGGIGEAGVRALDEFVRTGGTLVTLGEAADLAIDALGLPVRNVLRNVPASQFFCPGAVLEILVDNRHPLGYGMPERTGSYFRNSPAFELVAPFTASEPRAVVRYPTENPLKSGWIGGPEHLSNRIGALEVRHGSGRVILFGFPVQWRAQPHATFKLLFNALHWSAATTATVP